MMKVFSIHQDIRPPLKADASALGQIPISAYRYCEAVRTVSAMGWYVFPPTDFSLAFDGKEVSIACDGEWRSLRTEPLPVYMEREWEENYEADYGACPNMLTEFTDTGIVQIFTGLFVVTSPGYWCHVRPLINIHAKNSYWCFEGVVETDSFQPMPLFCNIRLTKTNSEIFFEKEFPICQMLCTPKQAFASAQELQCGSVFDPDFPKMGLHNTLRRKPGTIVPPGEYATDVRRRKKQEHPAP